jgi:SAM-dependent methyltransferase
MGYMMAEQSIVNKKGEVTFRKKLAQQHRGEKHHFDEELDVAGIMDMIDWRIQRTREMAKNTYAAGICMSPFLEIGAERCQRSLMLENELGFPGIAADISLDSLLFAERIAVKYGYKKLPVRICCDANNIPVRAGAIPFVFFYQTIHHFSDPSPVLSSINRILTSRGCLFFDEEPTSMRASCKLFLRGNKPVGLMQKILTKLHLMDFVSGIGSPEVRAGITETDFTLRRWGTVLNKFDYSNVIVDSKLLHGSTLNGLLCSNGLSRFWVELMGGNIHGLCRKKQKAVSASMPALHNPMDALICPECLESGSEQGLRTDNGKLVCSSCGKSYSLVKGVYMLFTKKLGSTLYPEHFN